MAKRGTTVCETSLTFCQNLRKNIVNLPGNKKPSVSLEFTIKDISAEVDKFTLDDHGFQYIKHQSGLSGNDFQDDEKIQEVYYAESIDLLKRMYVLHSLRQPPRHLTWA